jgi:hypothetical protein
MSVRRVSLGVRYPPLPRWMGVRRDGGEGMGRGTGRGVPRWMEKLPGNFGGLRGWRGRGGSGTLVQGGGGGYRGYGRVRGSSDGGC